MGTTWSGSSGSSGAVPQYAHWKPKVRASRMKSDQRHCVVVPAMRARRLREAASRLHRAEHMRCCVDTCVNVVPHQSQSSASRATCGLGALTGRGTGGGLGSGSGGSPCASRAHGVEQYVASRLTPATPHCGHALRWLFAAVRRTGRHVGQRLGTRPLVALRVHSRWQATQVWCSSGFMGSPGMARAPSRETWGSLLAGISREVSAGYEGRGAVLPAGVGRSCVVQLLPRRWSWRGGSAVVCGRGRSQG